MKICFVAPRLHTNQHAWIDTLTLHGHDVAFIVTNEGRDNQHHKNFQPRVIASKRLSWLPRQMIYLILNLFRITVRETFYSRPQFRDVYSQIKLINPDIVIVRDVAQILSLQTFLTTKLLGIETILYSQHPLEKKLKLHIRFFQILKLVPKKHITPVRNNPHQVYNKQSNSYYVPLFTPFTPNIHNRKARCSKKINIIFVGKFSLIRKNHLLMLRAFKNILQSCEAHLTMVGTVNTENPQKIYNDVNDYIISNNLSNNVDIKTNLPYEEMVEEYRKNDILALPSINEPFSITPIEAMSFGLPVIVSESNGTKGCIINGENGFIIADNNQAELEKSLLFFTKKKELGSFREKAYSYIKSQHSSKKFYNHFISAIQKIKYDS